jgi:hypothetical protein
VTSEYYLVPTTEDKTYPESLLERMHQYLRQLPSYVWPDGTYILFRDAQQRDSRVPVLLENSALNDYLDPMIHLDPQQIWLSVVGDSRVDRYVYDFALWCRAQRPCELTDAGEQVPFEVLLVA